MYFAPASAIAYLNALQLAQYECAHIAGATTPYADMKHTVLAGRCYLSPDHLSGFCVKYDGELVGVFSQVRGRGDGLISSATRRGATYLDCFDGYLPTLYAKHGFYETRREANWGGAHLPAVVYMKRGGAL